MAARECTIDIEVRVSRWRKHVLRIALGMAHWPLARPVAQRLADAASRRLVWTRTDGGRWEPVEL